MAKTLIGTSVIDLYIFIIPLIFLRVRKIGKKHQCVFCGGDHA